MYKFNNGLVIYDEETKEGLLKQGYKIVEDNNENSNNNKPIETKLDKSPKGTRRIQK